MSSPVSFDVADFVAHARGADGFVKVDGCTWYMSIIAYVCNVLVNFDNEPRGDRPEARSGGVVGCGMRLGSEGVRHRARGWGGYVAPNVQRPAATSECSTGRLQPEENLRMKACGG